jgi:hypothetical protein
VDTLPYASPQAFGAALADRLRAVSDTSPYTIAQLRKQFAYDRLLARLFGTPGNGWILKGGVSMIARLAVARHTADIDLVLTVDSSSTALAALQQAVTRDEGDYFSFRLGQPRSLVQGVAGLRIATEARIGPRLFERFGIDLVNGVVITGRPEAAEPLFSWQIPGLSRPQYLLYPIVDSLADKVAAISERHNGRPSTRYRDLVDIVLIARSKEVDGDELIRALASERLRRGLADVAELVIPDEQLWRKGYGAAASDLPQLKERSLDSALLIAKALIDPAIAATVDGRGWDPTVGAWTD